MVEHNPDNKNFITCRKCGERSPRAHPDAGRICRECAAVWQRQYRADNPEKVRETQRRQYTKNKQRKIARNRAYRRLRRVRDPVFAAEQNVRTAVNNAIRNGGGNKWGKTAEIIGRSPADVARQAISMGWRKGMHLDHIVSFHTLRQRYPGDERRVQREAWKACNLRVISAKENQRKNKRRDFLI